MDVHALDQAVRVWVVDHRHERLNPILLGLTIIGGGGLVWSLIAIVLVVRTACDSA